MSELSEKARMESDTAELFLKLYNEKMGSGYRIVAFSDAPDVRCRNADGEELKLEITTTEDRPGDMQAFFGRSDSRSLAALIRHLEAVHRGEESIFQSVSSSGTICQMVAGRIRPKLMKDYGPNVALVVRDTSGVPWDWSAEVERIASLLDLRRNPYDKGIWIVSPIGQGIVQVA